MVSAGPGTPYLDARRARRLAIALGDPAGIGIEVTLKALARPLPGDLVPVLVGCRRWLERSYEALRVHSREALADPADFEVVDLPLLEPAAWGQSTPACGDACFHWLTAATEQVLQGDCDALVTAPIAKASWAAAGHPYPGQTERLSELAGGAPTSMLFTARSPRGNWRLNTLLATTHIPLAAVPAALGPELVQTKLDVLLSFCQRFSPRPRLVVAGLNPHAGEAGQLGREELEWLNACLEDWRKYHPNVTLQGPLPPDTCWLDAGSAWHGHGPGADGYLALYHDQGLIPVKLLAFDAAVNTSLGLPFLRTSPDHGTGFDIAGQGVARPDSMAAAITTAWEFG
ncbi:4-hydroxythreonine-4-phosphate dehydrogenase PdxA [Synechococcus sp. CBW1002]|jgi:4-hydroxythreonine-4-phosphate dehydrogenase|uniref:4-hydroxythreonine-4-phosphate dehydrogenase PdxA n=1 Tax=Synechococcus sp. CBW1002 TaxID=1353134 RepID=UPI0018CCC84B|nr:4-hydroxythreonine-4-phosphate dehydrogenase PdxA [Synechococcus sp. CBW1002]QPN60777.1 4-hydroxythreonine-4-phosphate dehydrogenase PdxA [Synechococcus sp. CBW1002]